MDVVHTSSPSSLLSRVGHRFWFAAVIFIKFMVYLLGIIGGLNAIYVNMLHNNTTEEPMTEGDVLEVIFVKKKKLNN